MKIALLPISGKPVHAGHWGLIEIAANENDEVHLFVSTSDRARPGEMTISGEAMKMIWDRFLEPVLPSNVIVMYGGAPVGNVYRDLIQADTAGSDDIYTIYSDIEDIKEYKDSKLAKLAPAMFKNKQIKLRGIDRSETVNVSGTKMRALLTAGETKKFAELLPPAIQKHAQEIINILKRKSIGETLLRQYVNLKLDIRF